MEIILHVMIHAHIQEQAYQKEDWKIQQLRADGMEHNLAAIQEKWKNFLQKLTI